MMKSHRNFYHKWLVINIGVVLSTIFMFVLTCCKGYQVLTVTYHKPVMVCTQPDRIVSSEECVYVYDYWHLLTKINKRQIAERFYYPNEKNKRNINYIDSVG